MMCAGETPWQAQTHAWEVTCCAYRPNAGESINPYGARKRARWRAGRAALPAAIARAHWRSMSRGVCASDYPRRTSIATGLARAPDG